MRVEENVSLAPLTTLKIGGPARYLACVQSLAEVREALAFGRARALPVFVLGGGSNLVVPDCGYPGLVLKLAEATSIVRTETSDAVTYDVSAGTDWDAFVLATCRDGLCGVECLAGIPGLTGGTPVQNVGAYGQEVAGTIAHVLALDLLDLGAEPRLFPHADCGFAYRQSRFNSTDRSRWLVLSVRFRLARSERPNLTYADLRPLADSLGTGTPGSDSVDPLAVYHFVREVRARKGMLVDPVNLGADARSAGSFFKNPVIPEAAIQPIAQALALDAAAVPRWPADGGVKLPAAWLIERAGFAKGYTLGEAGISSRHTLALINRSGTASCADLLALRDRIAAEVFARFGVRLEQEPVLLG